MFPLNMLRVGALLESLFIFVGSCIQTASTTVTVFAVGRFLAGIAAGMVSTLPNDYINEVSPPHLRNALGGKYAVAIGVGLVVPVVLIFVADTATGWRIIAAVPMLFAVVSFVGAYLGFLVESPTWLLTQGRLHEAEDALTRLFGGANVGVARSWMDDRESSTGTELENAEPVMTAYAGKWAIDIQQQRVRVRQLRRGVRRDATGKKPFACAYVHVRHQNLGTGRSFAPHVRKDVTRWAKRLGRSRRQYPPPL